MSIYRTNVLHEKQRVDPFYQPELSRRYQLWENLRTLEVFRKSAIYIALFNLISTLACTGHIIQISPLFLNVFYELFDLSFAL